MLFAIWLGGDLGVFYASRFTVRPDLSPEARSVAVKIMNGLDQCPKVCLVLFLPSGFTLMSLEPHGARVFGMAPFGPWSAAVVWIAALGWLFLAIAAHRGRSGLARRLDWAVRGALIAGSGGAAAYTLTADEPFGVTTDPRWLGGKLALYAFIIGCGLAIRLELRPFGPAFARLQSHGSTPAAEADLRRAVRGCLPYVFAIWASLLVISLLGLLKPGARLP
ncbi:MULTISPECIES: hypothetical protein [Actinomadura]|uniref:Uncharacterized protein n=1 Tax=Actinomadura yumaensis TaxID=111807 RepID=A0ABW2CEA0_9ACTN|nr:hypothetical protein [Actinomadura sp. J1-007]